MYSQNETELHMLLREGWRGWLQPNCHLEGFDCYGHSLPCGCHYQRRHRRCFLGICRSFLFYLSFKVFHLSLLSVFMKAHPLSQCVAGSSKDNSVVLHTSYSSSSASTVLTGGRGGVAWRALGACSVQSTTHGSCTRGGSSWFKADHLGE